MSEFLKFAYELLSQVVYNIVSRVFPDFPYIFSYTGSVCQDPVSDPDDHFVCHSGAAGDHSGAPYDPASSAEGRQDRQCSII